jgi:CRISPR-associated exonuclease Cas4
MADTPVSGSFPSFPEEELLPVSALSDLVFCARRWGLVHLEGLWSDNLATVEGALLHQRVDRPAVEVCEGVRLVRSLEIHSLRLGLVGRADVVEFHPVEQGGVELAELSGRWRVVPVEYKRGRRREELSFEVQLCAQAMCLEEMLGAEIREGLLYFGKTRNRRVVELGEGLRREVERQAARMHRLWRRGETPPPEVGPKCRHCSLEGLCLPGAVRPGRRVRTYLGRAVAAALRGED